MPTTATQRPLQTVEVVEIPAVSDLPTATVHELSRAFLHAGPAELARFEQIAQAKISPSDDDIAAAKAEVTRLRQVFANAKTHEQEFAAADQLHAARTLYELLLKLRSDAPAKAKELISELREEVLLRARADGLFETCTGFPYRWFRTTAA